MKASKRRLTTATPWALALLVALGVMAPAFWALPGGAAAQDAPETVSQAEQLYRDGVELYNRAQYREALQAFNRALALDPDLALLDSILPYVDIDDLNLPPDIVDGGDATPNRDVTSLDIDVGGKPQFINNLRRSWIDLRN